MILSFFTACCKIQFEQEVCDNQKEVLNMAFVIKDGCISCGACAGQCPVGAISEGDGKFEIDENTCVSCGACAAQCPVGAIEEG